MTSAVFVGWQVQKVLKISIDSAKEDNEEKVDWKQWVKNSSRGDCRFEMRPKHMPWVTRISQAFIFLVTGTPLEGCKIHVSI